MAKKTSMKQKRVEWLDSKKLTIRKFAEATNNDFGTAYKWFASGRTPRRKYLKDILLVFPDWPHNA